jgi:hypothetical protein
MRYVLARKLTGSGSFIQAGEVKMLSDFTILTVAKTGLLLVKYTITQKLYSSAPVAKKNL